jgi:putative tricarboxylic transport membrane protein
VAINAKTGEAALGCALGLGGIVLAVLAARMPAGTVALPGPGFVPLAIGVLLALVGAGCAVSAWVERSRAERISLGGLKAWGALAVLAVAAFAFEPLGAPITLGLAMAVLARLIGGYGLLRSALFGVLSSAVAWLVFTRLLGVGLPAGLLPL